MNPASELCGRLQRGLMRARRSSTSSHIHSAITVQVRHGGPTMGRQGGGRAHGGNGHFRPVNQVDPLDVSMAHAATWPMVRWPFRHEPNRSDSDPGFARQCGRRTALLIRVSEGLKLGHLVADTIL